MRAHVRTAGAGRRFPGAIRRGLGCATSGHPEVMANYRVIDPHGTVVDTKDISSAEDAQAWFKDSRADNEDLGWRLEVEHDGEWAFFSDSEGTKD